jgi:hypothetical protein
MSDFDIDMRVVDGKQAVDDTTLEYVPFGVKVLKLHIRKLAGPATKVWIRTQQFKRDQDPCAVYGYADDGEDLIAVWGAGDIMGFCAKYAEQAGTKKTVLLDDDQPHTIYLHLMHRPTDPLTHQPRDRHLTVVAVTTEDDAGDLIQQTCQERQHHDRIIAEKTFTLRVPTGAGNPVRPVWSWGPDTSQIVLQGDSLPGYVPRWWPSREVDYAQVEKPPRITLDYARLVTGNAGAIDVWLGEGASRQHLARVTGHLTFPLHDLRWVIPELYRFYDDKLYVLRLWFYWVDEDIDADDLLTFVPEAHKDGLRDRLAQAAAELMKPKLLGAWPGWGKQYEIPDVERFDIVFDPDNLRIKYGCSDAHWREFWFRVGGGQPCQCTIAAPKDALKVVAEYVLRHLRDMGAPEPLPITNPLEEGGLVSPITQGRCYYDDQSQRILRAKEGMPPKAPGVLGKNAPNVVNAQPLPSGLSSDVLEG